MLIKRSTFLLLTVSLLISNVIYATDLSGFYRCNGSKTLLATPPGKLPTADLKSKSPATHPSLPADQGPVKINLVATQPISSTNTDSPSPIVAETEEASSDNSNNNAIPLNSLVNLRPVDNTDNVYGYSQLNDDGTTFWGTVYFEAEHLVAGIESNSPQKGVLDLQVKMDDGTFMGHFFMGTTLKGSLMCSKLQ